MSSRSEEKKKTKMVEFSVPLGLLNASYAATESFAGGMTDEKGNLAQPREGLTEEAFETRKRFGCLTKEDAALLADLRGVFEKHSHEVVDRFYAHLLQFDALRPLLADEATVKRLKGFQRDYLVSLASGNYDGQYAEDRLRIGRVHNKIGLDPEWYLGTYGLYLDLLFPLIHERFASDARQAVRASAALAKLMILDMQLVLDAYYGLQQKKAVERSEQLAAVGELAASIAHEVRNPLAGMKGALEVLRKELTVNPANQEIVDELLAQIVRLEHLVRDLLTFARPQALSRQLFDLHELLDRLLRLYKDESDSQGVAVHRIYESGTGRLTADPRQMEQVFLNLIHNALQAMPDGGTLTVTTRVSGRSIAITFSDTGKGIPTADLPKIFQPFFTTKHRGSGLGLSIVRKISEAHGGSVEIRTDPGKGTSATVIIPNDGSE